MVEITDQIFGTKLKEFGHNANADLYDFHKLLSIPVNKLGKKERQRIAEIVWEYKYLEKISSVFAQNYIDVRSRWNVQRRHNKTFILISTDLNGIPDFKLFPTFDEAEKAYFELYTKNNESCNIVLTHIRDRSFSKVSTAYSNYFMTYNSILVRIHKILGEVVIQAYNSNNISEFSKYYRYYLEVVYDWNKKEKDELSAFAKEHSKSPKIVTRAKSEWFESLTIGVRQVNDIFVDVNRKLKWNLFKIIPYLIKRKCFKEFRFKIERHQ